MSSIDVSLEVVGTLLFYTPAYDAEDIKEAVVQLEGRGNIIIDIIPVHASGGMLEAVFLKVAGTTRAL